MEQCIIAQVYVGISSTVHYHHYKKYSYVAYKHAFASYYDLCRNVLQNLTYKVNKLDSPIFYPQKTSERKGYQI